MERNSLFCRIESAGKLRDGLIVIVTLIYITGYAAWSYISWHNGFGGLPVLDAQYFLAGFPPFLSTVLVIIIIRFLRSFLLLKWPIWLQGLPFKKQVIVHISIFLLPICSIALLLLKDLFNWPSKDQDKIISIAAILSFLIIFSLLFEPKLLIDKENK